MTAVLVCKLWILNGGQRRDRSFHGCCSSVSYRKQNDKKSENATSPGLAVQNWYKGIGVFVTLPVDLLRGL